MACWLGWLCSPQWNSGMSIVHQRTTCITAERPQWRFLQLVEDVKDFRGENESFMLICQQFHQSWGRCFADNWRSELLSVLIGFGWHAELRTIFLKRLIENGHIKNWTVSKRFEESWLCIEKIRIFKWRHNIVTCSRVSNKDGENVKRLIVWQRLNTQSLWC